DQDAGRRSRFLIKQILVVKKKLREQEQLIDSTASDDAEMPQSPKTTTDAPSTKLSPGVSRKKLIKKQNL
ncbi:hypothetical protein BVRB_042080, partial [Beta vulgaris subsp. vulgaris]